MDLTGHALFVAIYEKEVVIDPSPGINGQTEFHHVFRDRVDTLPTLGALTRGSPQQFDLTLTSGAAGADAYVAIAFVQHNTSHAILQAGSTAAAKKAESANPRTKRSRPFTRKEIPMKSPRPRIVLTVLAALLLFAAGSAAAQYSFDWTFDRRAPSRTMLILEDFMTEFTNTSAVTDSFRVTLVKDMPAYLAGHHLRGTSLLPADHTPTHASIWARANPPPWISPSRPPLKQARAPPR